MRREGRLSHSRRSAIHIRCRQRGLALLELAVIANLMLVLLFSCIELGRALTQFKQLVAQVDAAARYLKVRPPGSAGSNAAATCLVRYGVLAATCSGTPLLPGLETATVTIMDATTTPASHRRQRTTSTGSDTTGLRVNLVTVSLSGFRYRLVAAGILKPVFGDTASIPFPTLSATHRQAID